MDLTLKTSDGKLIRLERLQRSLSFAEVKHLCEGECGFAGAHQQLFYKGKQLDDSCTLEEAGITGKVPLFLKKATSWGVESAKGPAGTVPCAAGCGQFGTARTDNYCTKCFAKRPRTEREALWRGILEEGAESQTSEVSSTRCSSEVSDAEVSEEFTVGTAVKICGLRSAIDLNGRRGWVVKYVEETSRYCVKLKGIEGTKALRPENLHRLHEVAPLSASKVRVQRDKTKCWICSKRCGLVGFECRCGYVFCSMHRHAEDHHCDFDHTSWGREVLKRKNPRLVPNCLQLLGA